MFHALPSSVTNISFVNRVVEDTTFNVFEYMNIYTGAGVAAGDVNNDGLTDLYFSANRGGGKLFINKGNLKFEDVTESAGLLKDRWETGVSMVDINQDGWTDIYVNVSGNKKFGNLANLLYVNQHNGTFKEEAEKYGIADERLTMNASFFDYDGDRDLDLFLITNPADERVSGINMITERKLNGESAGTDILYKNNGDGTFTDVSKEAGILVEGYSLGAAISDVNADGWPDIYISNDFLSNDIFYINNGDGTFTDQVKFFLKHTSFASMGNDIADFNDDGLPDIYVLDMLPEDNYRRKMIMPATSYDKFKLSLDKGYSAQYSRNTLQLNNGDSSFSDVAFLSGVSSTDWSWSALFADYDNDADKDLMVTNGFYRDLGNLDYIHYQAKLNNPMGTQDAKRDAKLKAVSELPQIPLNDYLFENNGDLTFTKRSQEWGFDEPGFSNGATYADLDNDGDLDLVINCFNSKAKLFENTANTNNNNYVRIKMKGKYPNIEAIGTKIYLYADGKKQFSEFYLSRGYESSVEPYVHFGIGKSSKVDSIVAVWPDGTVSTHMEVNINSTIVIDQQSANRKDLQYRNTIDVYSDARKTSNIDYLHRENEYNDFKVQPLLPHMHSQGGPGIAVADVNGDGLEDFYVGAASGSEKFIFFQEANGKFTRNILPGQQPYEDMGVLFFDADNDNDNDLYVVSGGSEHREGTAEQQDRLYINNGKGKFTITENVLGDTRSSGSCVVAGDIDRDGDLDLFIGGRVSPGKYPLAPKSYLLRNDSKNGEVKFKDVTPASLSNIGMVTSALWTDTNNDGWCDLLLAGEFMPITLFNNNKGVLAASSKSNGLQHTSGWWNSIAAADVDDDGDMDYFAGNLGLNSRHKASVKEPLCIYAKDFDKNGLIDPVMCYYVDGENHLYPTRDEMIRQINPIRNRFKTYESFAAATFNESFTKEELSDAYVVKSETFASIFIENKGGGSFVIKNLPVVAQTAPVYAIVTGDFTQDGKKDVLLAGNSYATEASTGRYDAMNGVLLAGDGKAAFTPVKNSVAGLKADGDVKSMVQLFTQKNDRLLLVGNNNDSLLAFRSNLKITKLFVPGQFDAYALIKRESGTITKHEFYYGNNYLSHSSRKIILPADTKSVEVFDFKGNRRYEKF